MPPSGGASSPPCEHWEPPRPYSLAKTSAWAHSLSSRTALGDLEAARHQHRPHRARHLPSQRRLFPLIQAHCPWSCPHRSPCSGAAPSPHCHPPRGCLTQTHLLAHLHLPQCLSHRILPRSPPAPTPFQTACGAPHQCTLPPLSLPPYPVLGSSPPHPHVIPTQGPMGHPPNPP